MRIATVFLATLLLWAAITPPPLQCRDNSPPWVEFDRLNSSIRDGLIARGDALAELRRLLPQLKEEYSSRGGKAVTRSEWRFPIEGYTLAASGNRGRDYVASGYDYFAGNRHGGHPSFDLFIHDRNRDDLDDGSGMPVRILSMTGGIVVALTKEWQPGSSLRGGKYIWVYDPTNELLVYYAHNRDILVNLGDILRPGEPIATVGRTGLNAHKRRSPTHLHLTCLKLENSYPRPENIFRDLQRVGRKGTVATEPQQSPPGAANDRH